MTKVVLRDQHRRSHGLLTIIGWCAEGRDPNFEYARSWTWFEAGTIPGKPPVQTLEQQPQGRSHDGVGTAPAPVEPEEGPPSKRHLIQRNVCASDKSRKHIVTWTHDNSSPEIREWLASIRPSDTIGVFPKAMYPGWVNHVKYVKLEVFCAWAPV